MPKKPDTHSPASGGAPGSDAADDHQEADLHLLVQAIYSQYSYDFRDYAGASQKRRVLKALTQLGYPTIPALQAAMAQDPAVFMQLLQYLTIPVSEMFRDPSFFLALRQQVMPVLRTYPSLKIWVAGCSTGEEVYSLAILLKEEGLLDRSLIYATDINPKSLAKARQGIFSLASIQGHTANYQAAGGRQAFSDYYTAAYDAAVFDKSLRDNITFADHSLATDSVFSETQLVLCRNVLIYFNKKLQDRALGLFHESLSHRGFMGLGSKESIDFSTYAQRFEPLDRPERIFRKLEA
ncbi:MAG: protein-glutamate O-methyltransferase CheR [Polaromonas sp.]|uniref:CheR family methyltransferase n=1 Tax=Polaromonas sp. TaxID=1869339 RepID=UPI002487D60A|nr:protein-glutamate O-methyltransferase CheR [Polaromonas sp.]MDI1268823.1 protein-glutamate O-methyltransferase CheR [Polaromonas sp.]